MIFTYTADTSLIITNPRFKYFDFSDTFLERVICSKQNLTKLYNCFFYADKIIDPITVNYFTVSNRWYVHPGYNRIVGAIMAKREYIKSVIFSQAPIENMQVIHYKVFENLKPIKKDFPVIFSAQNALAPHFEYRALDDEIDYCVGVLNNVAMKIPQGSEFIVGDGSLENRIDITYNQDLSLVENIVNLFHNVKFDQELFESKNKIFLDTRKAIREQWDV